MDHNFLERNKYVHIIFRDLSCKQKPITGLINFLDNLVELKTSF